MAVEFVQCDGCHETEVIVNRDVVERGEPVFCNACRGEATPTMLTLIDADTGDFVMTQLYIEE